MTINDLISNLKNGAQVDADTCSEAQLWFAKQYVAYELKRDSMLASIAGLEEEAKKGAWKWASKGKENAPVLGVRRKILDAHAAIAALDASNSTIKKMIDEYRSREESDAEFELWLAGGPKPEYLRLQDEAEREEFFAECDTIKLGQPFKIFQMPPTPQPEEPAEWLPMTAEEYFWSVMPPPIVEEKVAVFKPSTRGRTPAWIQRFMARRAAKVHPQLVVSEIHV